MFFKRIAQDRKPSSNGKTHSLYVDTEVRSAVAGQYSLMDREHARIREAALATTSSPGAPTELSENHNRSESVES